MGTKLVAVIAREAKQSSTVLRLLDCRVASLLAMTAPIERSELNKGLHREKNCEPYAI
jgi:hypothetical protein